MTSAASANHHPGSLATQDKQQSMVFSFGYPQPPVETMYPVWWARALSWAATSYKNVSGKDMFPSMTGEQFIEELFENERFDEAFGTPEGDENAIAIIKLAFEMLETGAFRPPGRTFFSGVFNDAVKSRRATIRMVREHPEVMQIPIRRPIMILGLHRSGTTLLQRLLSVDPAARSTKFFELWSDVEYPATSREEYYTNAPHRTKKCHEMRDQINGFDADGDAFRFLNPNHYAHPHEPEEIYLKMIDSGLLTPGHLYSCDSQHPKWDELMEAVEKGRNDNTGLYLLRYLQCLASGYNPDSHFVLKDPMAMWYIESVQAAIPDVELIFCHRDPRVAGASMARINYDINALMMVDFSKRSLADYGRTTERMVGSLQRKMVAYRKRELAGEVRPCGHVLLEELVRDPIAAVERLYGELGYEVSDEFRANMRQYMADNPRHKYGKVPYSLEMFEMDPARFVDPEYEEMFINNPIERVARVEGGAGGSGAAAAVAGGRMDS